MFIPAYFTSHHLECQKGRYAYSAAECIGPLPPYKQRGPRSARLCLVRVPLRKQPTRTRQRRAPPRQGPDAHTQPPNKGKRRCGGRVFRGNSSSPAVPAVGETGRV